MYWVPENGQIHWVLGETTQQGANDNHTSPILTRVNGLSYASMRRAISITLVTRAIYQPNANSGTAEFYTCMSDRDIHRRE